jgi:hypothetical protein
MREWLHRIVSNLLGHPETPSRIVSGALADASRRETLEADSREQRKLMRRIERENYELRAQDNFLHYENAQRVAELIEARQMCGTGPWARPTVESLRQADAIVNRVAAGLPLRESISPLVSQGAYGDIELALQNVEWRREINLSWLEFSRWGVQQIILISRLYYVKNPLIQRGINVSAHYVFGRGVEISSPDQKANEAIQDFIRQNEIVLSLTALVELHKRLYYDGQIFFLLIPDEVSDGTCKLRTIDATEIQEVQTNPNDSDEPWMYRREWWEKGIEWQTGSNTQTTTRKAWYPALGYDPAEKPPTMGIDQIPVFWDQKVVHFKSGNGVSKWHFDLPKVYGALDWAKSAKEFLENCATVRKALARIAIIVSTKGGQQALEGIKQQFSTTVGPDAALWDYNPPATTGALAAMGPGTTFQPFPAQGKAADPEEVRRFIHMVAMYLNLPEHFFADVTVGSRATAATLDRPTELAFLEQQERWTCTLQRITKYALQISMGAENGKLREHGRQGYKVVETIRVMAPDGASFIAARRAKKPKEIEVDVTFPSIREGDLPELSTSLVAALTLNNKGGQIVGVDEKAGILKLMQLHGIEEADEIIEQMYPEQEYERDRTKIEEPPPIAPAKPQPGVQPSPADAAAAAAASSQQQKEARLIAAIQKLAESVAKIRAA